MLIVLSLDHRRTTVAERERFMLPADAQNRLARLIRLGCGGQVAFLNTCNRVEVIAEIDADHPAEAAIRLGTIARQIAPELAAAFLARASCLTGEVAARHLFRVTAGLESQIPGDVQIIGQVRASYAGAAESGTVGAELHRAFQHALRSAKRVHAETEIGRRSASVGAVAAGQVVARLTEEGRGSGTDRTNAHRVLVIGAGKTAERAARTLAELGCSLFVSNRNRERAAALAAVTGAVVVPFEERYAAAARADATLVTTGAAEPTLVAGPLAEARLGASREQAPLLVLDLGVPRNVDPAVAHLGTVTLLGLQEVTDQDGQPVPASQWRAAERIVEDDLRVFWAWIAARAARRERVA